MLIFSVWDVWVFIWSLFWDLSVQKLLWFCSWICCNYWTFYLFCLLNLQNETFCWYRIVFSLLSCQLNSWLLAWLYSLSFQADRIVHSCVHSSELVIVWVFSLFHWTGSVCLSLNFVVNIVLQAVQCVLAFELEFEQSCLPVLSY